MKFDYDKAYRKQVITNISHVLKEIDSLSMNKKITNWANKFGYSFDEIYEKIKSDEIFRCVFIKEPAKQNIYENLALEFLQTIPNISNVRKDGQTHIVNGAVSNSPGESKSVDFTWESQIDGCSVTCYASHKHTKGTGGAQDNQFKDLKNFIVNCRNVNGKINPKLLFFAICDGDYYTKEKKNEMRNLAPSNCKVFSMSELDDFLSSQK